MKQKLRVLVVDQATGSPRQGVTIGLRAGVVENLGHNNLEERPLIQLVLQSDHVGFVSFELPILAENHFIQNSVIFPLAEPESTTDVLPYLRQGDPSSLIPLRISDSVRADSSRRFPPTLAPDAGDVKASPLSFATQPTLALGQSGCEEILLNRTAERSFRFNQIVLDQGNPPSPILVDGALSQTFFRKGALLDYEMQWIPLGHALGELVYSLPLAPCESVNLAVIEWERQDTASRAEKVQASEELLHSQRRDRAIQETVAATLREWQRGGSIMGGLSLSTVAKSVTGALALGGGYSTSKGNRDVNANTVQRLADSASQASSLVRTMYTTVVVQASQAERDVVETRTVTNHNHCHALTVLYYEVLRQYRIVTAAAGATDVVLVKQVVQDFDHDRALRYRPFLEPALLDQRLLECFDALERVMFVPIGADASDTRPLIKRFRVKTSTGDLGTDGYVNFRVRLNDDTIVHMGKMNNPGDDFDAHETNAFDFEGRELSLDQISQVGLTFREFTVGDTGNGQFWDLEGLLVEYELVGRGGLRTLYSDPTVNNRFVHRGEWWDSVTATPPTGVQNRAQRQLDDASVARLVVHLNGHRSYYWRVIWLLKDVGEYAVDFDHFRLTPGGPLLLDMVELRPVAVIGDYVAFPLFQPLPPNTDTFAQTFMRQAVKPQERFVSLPTRGVFAEAKLANCNACEERDITRFWDWSESPCPGQAPEITGVTPGSRARDISTSPTPLPSSVVNIVNPTAAPDPTGMVGALNLLATPDIFRDMSARTEVAGLLQKLSEGTVTLAQAKLQADALIKKAEIEAETERKRAELEAQAERKRKEQQNTAGPSAAGSVHDLQQVVRNSREVPEAERATMVGDIARAAVYGQAKFAGAGESRTSEFTSNWEARTPDGFPRLTSSDYYYVAPGSENNAENVASVNGTKFAAWKRRLSIYDPSTPLNSEFKEVNSELALYEQNLRFYQARVNQELIDKYLMNDGAFALLFSATGGGAGRLWQLLREYHISRKASAISKLGIQGALSEFSAAASLCQKAIHEKSEREDWRKLAASLKDEERIRKAQASRRQFWAHFAGAAGALTHVGTFATDPTKALNDLGRTLIGHAVDIVLDDAVAKELSKVRNAIAQVEAEIIIEQDLIDNFSIAATRDVMQAKLSGVNTAYEQFGEHLRQMDVALNGLLLLENENVDQSGSTMFTNMKGMLDTVREAANDLHVAVGTFDATLNRAPANQVFEIRKLLDEDLELVDEMPLGNEARSTEIQKWRDVWSAMSRDVDVYLLWWNDRVRENKELLLRLEGEQDLKDLNNGMIAIAAEVGAV